MEDSQVKDFKEFLKGKRIAIMGLGRSNLPLMRFLLKFTDNITGFDQTKANMEEIIRHFKERGVQFSLGEGYLENLKGFDIIFRSPGFHPHHPRFLAEVESGAILSSEMEVFFELCKGKIFGITGSDGKTTTTTLIYKMLTKQGYRCFLGGNIGVSLIEEVFNIRDNDMVILELSSFQLMTMKKSPHVAVITNISPNHLDVHTSMDEYVRAKMNIFLNPCVEEKANKHVVFNFNNAIIKSFAQNKLDARITWFGAVEDHSPQRTQREGSIVFTSDISKDSNTTEPSPCVDPRATSSCGEKSPALLGSDQQRMSHSAIFYKEGQEEKKVLSVKDILMPGFHNVENYMAAIGAVIDYVSPEAIIEVAQTFPGVEHRIEFVEEINGVKIYNDSIATSPQRTIAGLRSFTQKVILIAGGADKKLSFKSLGIELLDKVKTLVLVGKTARRIQEAFEIAKKETGKGNDIEVYLENDFERAVQNALKIAKPGDVVILSPASTSFDLFKNFEERGNQFKEIIKKIKVENERVL
jgi:UDP-N-acetylmuramoylalanine--D-glutamate ligase